MLNLTAPPVLLDPLEPVPPQLTPEQKCQQTKDWLAKWLLGIDIRFNWLSQKSTDLIVLYAQKQQTWITANNWTYVWRIAAVQDSFTQVLNWALQEINAGRELAYRLLNRITCPSEDWEDFADALQTVLRQILDALDQWSAALNKATVYIEADAFISGF